MSYKYWNKFVEEWRNLPPNELNNPNLPPERALFCDWTNPNLQNQLMNRPNGADYSINYIPEPWWGNNGDHALHSVVINYNPGSGHPAQHFERAAGLFGFPNYQAFANSEATAATNHFSATNNWHRNRRAMKIFNILNRIGVPLHRELQLQNHLSIELIPWHTLGAAEIQSYISSNLHNVFDYSIEFAANRSRIIANDTLKNKVLLRMSGNVTQGLLTEFQNNQICSHIITQATTNSPSGNGSFLKFKINEINDVEFISIWGRRSRNNFPAEQDLFWIFNNM